MAAGHYHGQAGNRYERLKGLLNRCSDNYLLADLMMPTRLRKALKARGWKKIGDISDYRSSEKALILLMIPNVGWKTLEDFTDWNTIAGKL